MENGKRKIMWCLTILVVAAVSIGVIYYVKTNMSPAQQTKGYLIRKVEEISHDKAGSDTWRSGFYGMQ